MEARVLEAFMKRGSAMRVLVSTVAMGMGVNIPDAKYAIHWGCSTSIPPYHCSHLGIHVHRNACRIPAVV